MTLTLKIDDGAPDPDDPGLFITYPLIRHNMLQRWYKFFQLLGLFHQIYICNTNELISGSWNRTCNCLISSYLSSHDNRTTLPYLINLHTINKQTLNITNGLTWTCLRRNHDFLGSICGSSYSDDLLLSSKIYRLTNLINKQFIRLGCEQPPPFTHSATSNVIVTFISSHILGRLVFKLTIY